MREWIKMNITENRSERQIVTYIKATNSPFEVTVSSFLSMATDEYSNPVVTSTGIGVQTPEIALSCGECLQKAHEVAEKMRTEIVTLNAERKNISSDYRRTDNVSDKPAEPKSHLQAISLTNE